MRNLLTYFFIAIIAVTSCKQKLEEPQTFFGNYQLEDSNFKLVGIGLQGKHVEGFKDFYIDDIPTLQKMQKQWLFKYSTEAMACGFGYEIKFIKDTTVLNRGFLNIECEYFNTDQKKWLHFPVNYLTDYVGNFKSPLMMYQEDLKSEDKGKICEVAYYLGEAKDSSAVALLLNNIDDPRITHKMQYKGMSVYQCTASALKKISGCDVNVNYKPDSAVIKKLTNWAIANALIKE